MGTNTSEPSEQELREMLESRTAGMEARRRRQSRMVSIVLAVMVLAVAGGLAVMWVSGPDGDAPPPSAEAKPAKTPEIGKIDKGDVKFAVELMEFMGAGSKGKGEKPKESGGE